MSTLSNLSTAPRLFCFGAGYSARVFARRFQEAGGTVAGTCRTAASCTQLAALGITPLVFARGQPLADPERALAGTTHLLLSVPPDDQGDSVFDHHREALSALRGAVSAPGATLRWIGYLSTTGVYGDTGGAWVDEQSPLAPSGPRQARRVAAERDWLTLWADQGLPVHVFRLAGIYGPGRSALDQVRAGTARRLDRPGHVFSRIHVEDIAEVLLASMARPNPGAVYNVCDDVPAEPQAVIAYACALLGVAPPPLVPFAAADLSPMALSFWQDNRRVHNDRIRTELGVHLRYPDYRAGLEAMERARDGAQPAPTRSKPSRSQ